MRVASRASDSERSGRIPGRRSASIVFPQPGGPTRSIAWLPAAGGSGGGGGAPGRSPPRRARPAGGDRRGETPPDRANRAAERQLPRDDPPAQRLSGQDAFRGEQRQGDRKVEKGAVLPQIGGGGGGGGLSGGGGGGGTSPG